ncbi:MAG: glycosyltransferase [Pseudomonadota bacterium]
MNGSRSPRVTVLMPVRDGGEFLHEAVQSILTQTFGDFEFLIVDDHSSDGELERLPNDSRLKILTCEKRGIVPALNLGIAHARGEYIARMDADDIAHAHRLQTQVEYLDARPHIGIAGAQVRLFGNNDISEGYRRYERWINNLTDPADIRRSIFIESPLPHPTAMLRRSVCAALNGYRDTPWPEDYDLWLRAYQSDIAMGKPEGVLLHWRDSDSRLSRVDERYSQKQFAEARANALANTVLRTRPAVICGTGPQALNLFDALQKRDVTILSFVDIHPRRIGGKKRGRPVVALDDSSTTKSDALLLGAVGAWDARERLKKFFLDKNLREETDFLMAA